MKIKLSLILVSFLLSVLSWAQNSIQYYGDGVRNSNGLWADSFQGMCHDEKNYYIVQRYYLWRIPRNIAIQKVKIPTRRNGSIKVGIPEHLKAQGAHHMGDCDAHNGLVFVPLEGAWPVKIMIFKANSLLFVTAPNLPIEQTDAPWVTVDPADGSIITGTFNYSKTSYLWRHRLSDNLQTLHTIGKIELKDRNSNPVEIKRVQGVELVRSRNMIWVTSDVKGGGLLGFDLTTGQLLHHRPIAYDPGFPKYEELEGMDALEDEEEKFPHYRGNLFVTMLNSNLFKDTGYIKLFEY